MATVLGIICGVCLIVLGISRNGTPPDIFYNPSGLAIVLGGTIAATFVSFPLNEVIRAFRSYLVVFKSGTHDYVKATQQMVNVIKNYNINGIRELESETNRPRKLWIFNDGVKMLLNGYNKEETRIVLEDQVRWQMNREQKQYQLFGAMAKFAPAFGMIGTLIGLIQMLITMNEGPEKVGTGLAIALTTTFYGLVLANLFFNPISEKIREQAENNLLLETMEIEGVMILYDNENYVLARDKLSAYISASNRKKVTKGLR